MSDASPGLPAVFHRMRAYEHKLLSFEQVGYDAKQDRRITIADGLDALSTEGWELVTTIPSYGYAPEATTLFIFRREILT